eukprot:11192113-Lingulodinium_polyedra.AAC.1
MITLLRAEKENGKMGGCMREAGRRNCASARARRRRTRNQGKRRELWKRNVLLHDIRAAVGAARLERAMCPSPCSEDA